MTSGNCEIFVSTDGKEFHKLDLYNNEKITMKYIRKDTQDLSKVFAPFSQGFAIPATPKNLRILNHFGDSNLVRSFDSASFECKIYLHGLLNKTGLLKIENIKYKNLKPNVLNVSFNSVLLSLKDRIGDDTIAQLTDNAVVSFLPNNVEERVKNTGFNLVQWYVPLMSNRRIWVVDAEPNSTAQNNIFFKPNTNPNSDNIVRVDELRPAVSIASIYGLIEQKYGLDINFPLKNRTEFTRGYLWCNGENFRPEPKKLILKKNYFAPPSASSALVASVNTNNSTVILSKASNVSFIILDVTFVGLKFLDKKSNANLKVEWIDTATNEVFASIEGTPSEGNNTTSARVNNQQGLSYTKILEIRVTSDTPIYFDSTSSRIATFVFGAQINLSFNNNISFFETGLHEVNLLRAIPETKISEFLSSIFKTFNVSAFENSDGTLDLLTTTDIADSGQTYASIEKDYTAYLTSVDFDKKVLDNFNYYNLKHKTSKYKANIDFKNQFGIEYGQATFPQVRPDKPREFIIETDWTIIPPVFINGSSIITAYGFGQNFEPNREDLTLFYNRGGGVTGSIGIQSMNNGLQLINKQLNQYQITSPLGNGDAVNGLNYGFSILVFNGISYVKTLYQNYYANVIQRLLNVNTLEHSFELTLPVNELNNSQSSGIQPNGFRLQNEIIIQEQRYEVVEMDLDITTGKAKAKLLNI